VVADTEYDGSSLHLSKVMSDELKALGFEPGWPIMELGGFDFGIDLIHEALIRSTYWSPVAVPLVYTQRVDDENWRDPVLRSTDCESRVVVGPRR
jgi:hypothetical protein